MKALTLALFATALSGTMAFAQTAAPAKPSVQITAAAAAKKVSSDNAKSLIHGTVVDADDKPLAHIPIRLRNLTTNEIEQNSSADKLGEFDFVAKPDVPYVVEVVDQANHVVAVGDVVVVHPGEIAGALVKIPKTLPTLSGIFGETAGSVVAAVVGTGVTVLQSALPTPPPLSPEK